MAAKEKKEANAEKQEAAICKLATIEQRMAENDAVDTTPRQQAGKTGPCQLRCTETYVQLTTDKDSNSDKEMLLDKSEPVMDHRERNDDTAMDYEALLKKKVKAGVHESIKNYLENRGEGGTVRGSANRGFHSWQLDANSGPTRRPTLGPTRVREFRVGIELRSSLDDKSLQLAESSSGARFWFQL